VPCYCGISSGTNVTELNKQEQTLLEELAQAHQLLTAAKARLAETQSEHDQLRDRVAELFRRSANTQAVAPLPPSPAHSSRILNLTGQRFGKLVALDFVHKNYNNTIWRCRCDCGAERNVRSPHLRSGEITQCADRRSHDRALVVIQPKPWEVRPTKFAA
jgi:hypothetical protein